MNNIASKIWKNLHVVTYLSCNRNRLSKYDNISVIKTTFLNNWVFLLFSCECIRNYGNREKNLKVNR